ncbi:hypothetical protein BDZ97DRAFT_1822680 [Flammula alnicola]|nr:hypothetical protein BDZ97DRAFT_1822680 [Flammula alnicola]
MTLRLRLMWLPSATGDALSLRELLGTLIRDFAIDPRMITCASFPCSQNFFSTRTYSYFPRLIAWLHLRNDDASDEAEGGDGNAAVARATLGAAGRDGGTAGGGDKVATSGWDSDSGSDSVSDKAIACFRSTSFT